MTKKSELSLMWQMKREAERDFNKFIKYVAELEKENKELKRDLEHRDTILSIMYDLVRDWYIDADSKLVIIKAVVDIEVGADVTEFQTQLAEMFYHRGFLHPDED